MAESPQFYDPHTSKRCQIDEQIVLLKKQIEALQILRNALVPISSLPDDVLANILLTCRDIAGMKGLLSLTWVCHHWRNVAIANASLWAFIGSDNLRWIKECLTRSKESPLHCSLNIRSSSTTRGSAVLLSQIHRMQHLHVTAEMLRADETHQLSEFLNKPAPMLRSLTLENMEIPNPLFSGLSPSLDTVTIRSCIIPSWTSGILPFVSLKHLALDFCRTITFAELLQSLPPSLPNLEVLILRSTLIPSPTPPIARIDFPGLKKFTIWSPHIASVVDPLQIFNFPSSTELTIQVEMTQETGETPGDIHRLLQAINRLKDCGFLSATLYHGITWITWDNTFAVQTIRDTGTDNGIGSLNIDISHGFTISEIVTPFSILAQSIKVLDLSAEIQVGVEQDFNQLLSPLIHLEELTLETSFATQCFFDFIVNATPTPQSCGGTITVTKEDLESDIKFPLKALKRLRIRECDLGSDHDNDTDTDSQTKLRAFCSALEVRQDCGFGLDDLWVPLVDCDPYHGRLCEVVEKVTYLS